MTALVKFHCIYAMEIIILTIYETRREVFQTKFLIDFIWNVFLIWNVFSKIALQHEQLIIH